MPRRPPSHKTKPKVCYLCGTTAQMTREHVIPKSVFLKPYPLNLITLPGCQTCNASYSRDDELFRDFVAGHAFKAGSHTKPLWDAAVRGMKRTPARYADAMSRIGILDIPKVDGTLGRRMAFPADRIGRVVHRMVRGLYEHHTGSPLPPNTNFVFENPVIQSTDFFDLMPYEGRIGVEFLGNQVAYAWGVAADAPKASMWYFNFHDELFILVITDDPEMSAIAPAAAGENPLTL